MTHHAIQNLFFHVSVAALTYFTTALDPVHVVLAGGFILCYAFVIYLGHHYKHCVSCIEKFHLIGFLACTLGTLWLYIGTPKPIAFSFQEANTETYLTLFLLSLIAFSGYYFSWGKSEKNWSMFSFSGNILFISAKIYALHPETVIGIDFSLLFILLLLVMGHAFPTKLHVIWIEQKRLLTDDQIMAFWEDPDLEDEYKVKLIEKIQTLSLIRKLLSRA